MAILERVEITEIIEDPRVPRRVLTAAEGEALLRRLSEPPRKPTPAMVEAVQAHKRLLAEPSGR